MIVYNISMKIDPSIEKDWLRWQQQEHIPAVMASGQFTAYKFYRLLEQDDRDSITYIIQYFASSLKNYYRYSEQTAPLPDGPSRLQVTSSSLTRCIEHRKTFRSGVGRYCG